MAQSKKAFFFFMGDKVLAPGTAVIKLWLSRSFLLYYFIVINIIKDERLKLLQNTLHHK